MSAVVEFVLALVDLIRAEAGRSGEGIFRFYIAMVLIGVAALFLAVAGSLLLVTVYRALLPVHPALATLVTSLASLGLAALVFWVGIAAARG